MEFIPRPGALRALIDDVYQYANPGDFMFSTLTMFAQEYWDGEAWRPIYTGDNENA